MTRGCQEKSSVLVNSAPHCVCSKLTTCRVLAPLLELSARSRQEVHVRVARPPSFRGHVSDAPDPQRQVSLTRLDPHGLPERFVFEPARDVRDDVASWQPSLAGAVDIRVAALAKADVTANVVMPAAEI